jgi:hypothetical protein
MELLYAMVMLLALVVAQVMLFGMIGRRLPDIARALAGLPVRPRGADQSAAVARLMRA